MHYEFKTRRFFGDPPRLNEIDVWMEECTAKYGAGVALPVKELPGTYAFYTHRQAHTEASEELAAGQYE